MTARHHHSRVLHNVPVAIMILVNAFATHSQQIKPRQPESDISDKGYPNLQHGWYDAQCQGANNDYCRYVDDDPENVADVPNQYHWSCALAGSTSQNTRKGQYEQYSTYEAPCPSGSYIPVDPTTCTTAVAQPDLDTVNKIIKIVANGSSFVPEVGPMLCAFANVLWPIIDSKFAPTPREISTCAWTATTSYVQQYVSKALDAVRFQALQDDLKGIGDLLYWYRTAMDDPRGFRNGTRDALLYLYNQMKQDSAKLSDTKYYTNKAPGNVLPILIPWVVMHVGVAQEYYCNQTLYDGYSDAVRRAEYLKDLNNILTEYVQMLDSRQAAVTHIERLRYFVLDMNWPNKHFNSRGVPLPDKSGSCNESLYEHCGYSPQINVGTAVPYQRGWSWNCFNPRFHFLDDATCFSGYACVWDQLLGASAMGGGVNLQANYTWWNIWYGGTPEEGYEDAGWDVAIGKRTWLPQQQNAWLPQHQDAVTAARQALGPIRDANEAHVAAGLQSSVGTLIENLQALKAQLAIDPTRICGPESDVVTDPRDLPPSDAN